MICFIVALKREADPLLEKLENLKESTLSGKPLYTGKFNGREVAVILSEIGKVSSALSTQAVIDKFSPDLIFNFGFCGGIEGTSVREIYYVTKSAQYDFDMRGLEDVPLGYNEGYDTVFFNTAEIKTDLKKGVLASSDKFTHLKKDVDDLTNMGANLYDMEGAAISQVAYSNNVPVILLKGVSDVFGMGSNAEQFIENSNRISERFVDEIENTINAFYNN